MAKRTRQLQRCMKNDRKGVRCGRYCAEGQTLCSVHLAQAAGKQPGVIKLQHSDDPMVLLKRLLHDPDASIRLRAVESLLRRQEAAECSRCAANAAAEKQQLAFLTALTEDDKAWLKAIFETLAEFKETIYARDPSLRPDDYVAPSAAQGDGSYRAPVAAAADEPAGPTLSAPVEGVITADGPEAMTAEWRPL